MYPNLVFIFLLAFVVAVCNTNFAYVVATDCHELQFDQCYKLNKL